MTINRICWEIQAPLDRRLNHVRQLYETTLDESERVPWEWLQRGLEARAKGLRKQKVPHLFVIDDHLKPPQILGFAFGLTITSWAGYLSYIGVAEHARSAGLGTLLMQQLARRIEFEFQRQGTELPFVLWESQRPALDDPESEWVIWNARLKLFARLGAYWLHGLQFQSPNYMDPTAEPTILELFVLPKAESIETLESKGLRRIAYHLYKHVYGLGASDPLVNETLHGSRKLQLVDPILAAKRELTLQ